MTFKRSLFIGPCILGISLILAGCSLAPDYERPGLPVPPQWPGEIKSIPGNSASSINWQDFVTDSRLRILVDLALTNNRDLRQTILNVEAAKAQYGIQRADRLPGLTLQGGGTRQRVPSDTTTNSQSQIQDNWQAGAGLPSFELDLFGHMRSLSEAQLQMYLASDDVARSARISLVSEVIQTYIRRDGALRRHRLTEQTLKSREASLELISRRRLAGTATALDYQEAKGLTEQVRADIESTEREVRLSTNALGLLVGVNDIAPYLADSSDFPPVIVRDLAPGTPSDLLENRPDILAAEHQLRARNADIGAARAAFFPRITLTGTYGSSSAELAHLFEGGQRAWSFSPQIILPIFDGGRNQANLDLAAVRRDIAVARYEQTIQTAFREVSDAIASTDTLRREESAQAALVMSNREALDLAQARYKAGVDDHLRYLDAQRRSFVSEISAIDVNTQRQIALVSLFRALGGDWALNSE
ncbi:efflux transporter outer membrane subunit [Raoultella terrigena]|uniref:efflux transporter outer membrane subunit n=1 Tax=Raoultella terrigena TaxID=577 RepID=UPI00349FA7E5